MQIAVLLFDGVTALDAIGPYEVLSRLPGAEVRFVAAEPGPKRTDDRALALTADDALDGVAAPGIVVVPGGPGAQRLVGDAATLAWLRAAHGRSRWTTSVCTGSLVLGAAGLLDGLRATTHWLSMDDLAAYGAEPTRERVVEEGRTITAAGVSAGIDMALVLAERVAGADVAQAIQLVIEYDPQPPFDAGAPQKAPAPVVRMVEGAAARHEATTGGG